jgi:hypothetical protein
MPWNAADMVSGSPSLRARISTLPAISQYPQLILIAHAKVIHMPGKRANRKNGFWCPSYRQRDLPGL